MKKRTKRKIWNAIAGIAGFFIGIVAAVAASLAFMSWALRSSGKPCESPCDGPAMGAAAVFTLSWPIFATFFALVFATNAWRMQKRRPQT